MLAVLWACLILQVYGAVAEDASKEKLKEEKFNLSSCSIKRPESRLLALEDSFKYHKLLAEASSAASAALKVEMIRTFTLDHRTFLIPALEMCLEFNTFPDRFGTLDDKREFLKKLFSLGFKESNPQLLLSSLNHAVLIKKAHF